ncbi:MAG: TlpA disulfide reductase family protein [Pseudomonadota bacterium]
MKTRAFIISLLMFVLAPVALAADSLRALQSLKDARTLDVSAKPFEPASVSDKPVVVAFFASWCPPCTNEFDEMAKVQKAIGDRQVTFIGVNLFEAWGGKKDPERMARFIARTRPDFALIDGSAEISAAFGSIDRIPTMVVFGPDGRETWRFVHERGAAKTHATADEIMLALQ